MLGEAITFCWSSMAKDIEEKVKTSAECMSSGKILEYQLPETYRGKIKNYSKSVSPKIE